MVRASTVSMTGEIEGACEVVGAMRGRPKLKMGLRSLSLLCVKCFQHVTVRMHCRSKCNAWQRCCKC